MAGYTDIIKQAVQLADDGGDLLGKVTCVHGDGASRNAHTLLAPLSTRVPSWCRGSKYSTWRCQEQLDGRVGV